ncbi:hypothetical protein XELAEV_18024942mg, partial [Xenopus laevis]
INLNLGTGFRTARRHDLQGDNCSKSGKAMLMYTKSSLYKSRHAEHKQASNEGISPLQLNSDRRNGVGISFLTPAFFGPRRNFFGRQRIFAEAWKTGRGTGFENPRHRHRSLVERSFHPGHSVPTRGHPFAEVPKGEPAVEAQEAWGEKPSAQLLKSQYASLQKCAEVIAAAGTQDKVPEVPRGGTGCENQSLGPRNLEMRCQQTGFLVNARGCSSLEVPRAVSQEPWGEKP